MQLDALRRRIGCSIPQCESRRFTFFRSPRLSIADVPFQSGFPLTCAIFRTAGMSEIVGFLASSCTRCVSSRPTTTPGTSVDTVIDGDSVCFFDSSVGTGRTRIVRWQNVDRSLFEVVKPIDSKENGVFLVKQLAIRRHAAIRLGSCRRSAGVYSGRSTQRRVNAQLTSLFAAQRPLASIRLAVSEKAPRAMPPGIPVTSPRPGTDGAAGVRRGGGGDSASTLPGAPVFIRSSWSDAATVDVMAAGSVAEPGIIATCAALSDSSARASSIIPSNRPRTETPRRAASASTQARRS